MAAVIHWTSNAVVSQSESRSVILNPRLKWLDPSIWKGSRGAFAGLRCSGDESPVHIIIITWPHLIQRSVGASKVGYHWPTEWQACYDSRRMINEIKWRVLPRLVTQTWLKTVRWQWQLQLTKQQTYPSVTLDDSSLCFSPSGANTGTSDLPHKEQDGCLFGRQFGIKGVIVSDSSSSRGNITEGFQGFEKHRGSRGSVLTEQK